MHISRYESLSNVSAFLTSNSATWSLVTESPAIWGTTIVLSRISEYRCGVLRAVVPLMVSGAGVRSSHQVRLVGVLSLISCVFLAVFGSYVVVLACPS